MTGSKLNPQDSQLLNSVVDQFSDIVTKSVGFHHPNIDPVALHLGPLDIRWYSLAYLAGIILGWIYVGYFNKKHANNYLPAKAVENLPLWMVVSVVLGGRIGYVLFYNFAYYRHNLADIPKVWMGGMSFHGGLIGIIIGTFLFSKLYGLKYLKVTDFIAIAAPIGLFFGRIANFINRELVGKVTSHSWGVLYPNETTPRHPSQLYEAGMEGLLLFLILFVTAKFFKGFERTGTLSGLFLIFYGIFRIIGEIFREPDKQVGYIYAHISMGQLLCVPMILLGVLILLFGNRNKKPI